MSGLTYNLQIDSKFRDVEKYPNPCDFGVTFINSTTGTSVLGQPSSVDQMFSPVQIDPDFEESDLIIRNAEVFTYNKVDDTIFIAGLMKISNSESVFSIDYQPQPTLQFPSTIISYTGYNIVSLTGMNILENPFLATITKNEEKYTLNWIVFIEQYTGVYSDVVNNSTRSTARVSPSQDDVIFWSFDFSTSINIVQYNNNSKNIIRSVPEPSNGNTSILITGFNIADGTNYKYEARDWGYQLITSDFSLEKTKENGRFNINVDDTNNLYVSGNVSNLNPSYNYLQIPFQTGPGLGGYNFDQDNLLYYVTGASGTIDTYSIFPYNIENSLGVGSTGNSYVLFTKIDNQSNISYLGQYKIEKDPGGIYQQLGFCRYGMVRVLDKSYLISAITDSTRSMTSYQSRVYEVNPTGATGTLMCYFGSGPSVTYYPAGLWSTAVNTDIYSFQRCGIFTGAYGSPGSYRSDKLLIHKFDTLTNVGTTVYFTGPIEHIPTGQNSYPKAGGGLSPGTQEDLFGQVVGTDVYLYMGNLNAAYGKQGLVMPLIVLKWDTVTNTLTNYGVKTLNPIWCRFRGVLNYASGRKILENSGNSSDINTYFYDITDPINITYITKTTNSSTYRKIIELNNTFYVGMLQNSQLQIYNFSDVANYQLVATTKPIAEGNFELAQIFDYKSRFIGYGGSDIDGWYMYVTQPIISDKITLNINNVTQNKGQTVHLDKEYLFQVSYIPKNYNNLNITNFSKKIYLFSIYKDFFTIDDISNINITPQRSTISLIPFNFQQHPNRPNGIYGTRFNTHVYDTENGIYVIFGFYNKIGLYFYNDNLNVITELYQESISSSLGGIVYIKSYFVNNDHFAIFIFVNNIIRIYKIINDSSFQLVSTTSSPGSFTVISGGILVYHTLYEQYFLHLIGSANFLTAASPRRANSINVTDPYNPVPNPSTSAYTFPTNIFASSNGMYAIEDENLNVALYVNGQTRFSTFDITVPTNLDFKIANSKNAVNQSYLQPLTGFYNPVNKRRYLICLFGISRTFTSNVLIFDITSIFNPTLIGDKLFLPENTNGQFVANYTIAQNESKTYCSFLIPNYYYSTGAWAPNPIPANGTTGATGADIFNNYLYYLYDLSNPEFANDNQNQSSTTISYPLLPNNGSSFLTKINADGSIGWFDYIGSHPNDPGLFTNISNFTLDKSKKYIYISGGWQNSVAFYQSSSFISSASGIFNYFKSPNTIYNSFVSKLNIFTGEWIWSLPLIGNLDDFTERLSYQNYNNNEVLLMSMYFNSFSLNTYQAINSSYNSPSTLNNIINILNNTASVSSALYAFNTNGSIAWTILFFSKTPLTNVYLLDVDSTNGIITAVGISNTNELYCIDASGNETQVTYSSINSLSQRYLYIYRFTYLGIYISSQRIDMPESNIYLNINDVKNFYQDNKFSIPLTFKNITQSSLNLFNKDGTLASNISQFTPLETNTCIVSYKNNSNYTDTNNKNYSKIKHLYSTNLSSGTNAYTNYYNYISGNSKDTILNNAFSIRSSFFEDGYLNTILNQYIDTSKIVRNFANYNNTGQFIRPDLNFYRTNLTKTPQNGYVIIDSIDPINGIIYLSSTIIKSFETDLFITISSGSNIVNIPVTYSSIDGQDILLYDQTKYVIPLNNYPYLIINSKNDSAYYTYQFYPGSLEKSNYFVIKKLTMTIPNRLIRNSKYKGLRDLNDLPYLYLKVFNQDFNNNIDINNFNLVYDNNINTGTTACFQFPISYAGSTSNFTTLTLDIQPRVKFSYNYYTFRFQLLDPKGDIIQFDPTPYKPSDSVFGTEQVPDNLLNVTVRMQISLSN